VLVSCFSAVELWVSVRSHSLSLLADAGHMVADVLAIALALLAASLSARLDHAAGERLNAIAALINGGLLLLVGSWLGWEAITALREQIWPVAASLAPQILSRPVAITAAVGLAVNGLNAYLIHAHADDNLNLRAAFLHMLADAASCLGVLVGALLIDRLGWIWADGAVSLAIALLILINAVPLMRQSWATLKAAGQAKQTSPENLQTTAPD
jgi:cobalt-zinc-cadmium efflux system protein